MTRAVNKSAPEAKAGSVSHTPGPWFRTDVRGIYALNDDGTNRFCAAVQGGYLVQNRWRYERTTDAEIEANARLMWAAPDLLEAIQAIRGWMPPAGHDPDIDEAMRKADAAIAKATGV